MPEIRNRVTHLLPPLLRKLFLGRIARGSIGSLFLQVAAVGLNLASAVLLARILGASGFGAYGFALACVEFLLVLAMLGTPQFLAREIPRVLSEKNWSYFKQLESGAFWVVLLWTLFLVSVGYLLAVFLDQALKEELRAPLFVGFVILPFLALVGVGQGALRGVGVVTLGQIPMRVVRPAIIVLSVSIVSLGSIPLGAAQAVSINLVATVVAFLYLLILWFSHRPKAVRGFCGDMDVRRLVTECLPFMLIAGLNVVNVQADMIMLGILATPEDTGLYRVANRLAQMVSFPLLAIAMPLEPVLAELKYKGDLNGLRSRARKASLAAFILGLILGATLIAGGTLLLGIFGSDFQSADVALTILTAGQVSNALFGIAILGLAMTGYEREIVWSFAATACVNIVANAVVIPLYGLEGAAVATVGSEMLRGILVLRIAIVRFGFDPTALGYLRRGKWRRI